MFPPALQTRNSCSRSVLRKSENHRREGIFPLIIKFLLTHSTPELFLETLSARSVKQTQFNFSFMFFCVAYCGKKKSMKRKINK